MGIHRDPPLPSTLAANKPETLNWARQLEPERSEWGELLTDLGRGAAIRITASRRTPEPPLPLDQLVEGHLRRWGVLEDYQKMIGGKDNAKRS